MSEDVNNQKGELTTLWELLNKYNVVIPVIQRDYAQGRDDAEAAPIREKFLDDLYEAVTQREEPLVLDYIYGSTRNTDDFLPIDGQQRLTTLWLLHRYFAWKDNISDAERFLEKFSYKVRDTATEFCQVLAANSVSLDCKTLSKEIKEKSWFHLSYNSDPTVKAMLNMFDCIHEKFRGVENGFRRLTEENVVKFWQLIMENFSLTNDLYIKMNARGKRLSSFEKFKSLFEQKMDERKETTDNKLIDQWKDSIDNDWVDFFFEKSGNSNDAENYLFRFICFFFNTDAVKNGKSELYHLDNFPYEKYLDTFLSDEKNLRFLSDGLNLLRKLNTIPETSIELQRLLKDVLAYSQSSSPFEYRHIASLYARLRYAIKFENVSEEYFVEFKRVLDHLITGEREVNYKNRVYQTGIDIKILPKILQGIDTLIESIGEPENILARLQTTLNKQQFRYWDDEKRKMEIIAKEGFNKVLPLEQRPELRGLIHNFISEDKTILLSAEQFDELTKLPKDLLLQAIQSFTDNILYLCFNWKYGYLTYSDGLDRKYLQGYFFGFSRSDDDAGSGNLLWTSDAGLNTIQTCVTQFIIQYAANCNTGKTAENTVRKIIAKNIEQLSKNELPYYLVRYEAFFRLEPSESGCYFIHPDGTGKFGLFRSVKEGGYNFNSDHYNPFYLALQEELEKKTNVRLITHLKRSSEEADEKDNLINQDIELSNGWKLELKDTGEWDITKPDGTFEPQNWQNEDRIAKMTEYIQKNVD